MSKVTNIVLAGIGGQGVIRASDILADVLFNAGYDVKQSEIHGMSQRGGSVSSDVRFGEKVFSPMVPDNEADFLMILEETQEENNLYRMRPDGVKLTPASVLPEGVENIQALDKHDETPLSSRNFNVALLGVLSSYLDIAPEAWEEAIRANLPAKVHAQNIEVFHLGRKLRAA
jgi:indolepyruvate ferredoxin oxidoreductase, beta subunit